MSFNEQAVLYDYEVEFIRRLTPVLRDLGVPDRRMLKTPERWGREAAQPHSWLMGKRSGRSQHKYKSVITFDGFFYNEEDPDVGKPTVQTLGEPRVIYSRVVDSDLEYEQTIDESTASTVEEWTEEEFGVEFNVTNRTTSKAEAKGGIDGIAEASVSVENETTTSLDTSFGHNDGARNSKQVNLAIHGKVTIPANQPVLTYAEAVKQQYITPYKVNGYIDHATNLDLYDWVEENSPFLKDGLDTKHNVIKNANLTELRSFLEGERVAEYPNMRGFLKKCSKGSRAFYEWLKDGENRHRQFERQKIVVAEQATEVKVKFVEG